MFNACFEVREYFAQNDMFQENVFQLIILNVTRIERNILRILIFFFFLSTLNKMKTITKQHTSQYGMNLTV